ncbi:MAG: APC family permease [Gemmataceae bacterium]
MADLAKVEAPDAGLDTEFKRRLGLFDATMVVAGSMIGSGIFLVSADMGRLLGSPGWLLVAWLVTGVLTVAGALCYGELAGMMPRAGGQYVFLRESLSPLWGFLYGWTFLLVIQAGTAAAVAVAFGRFAGVLIPAIDEGKYLIAPIHITEGYAVSLSTAQFVGVILIAVLTGMNMLGIEYGKTIQNIFTVTKIGALLALIVLGVTVAWSPLAVSRNFGDIWTPRPVDSVVDGLTAATAFGLFAAICVAQTGSMFSADAWHSIAIVAGEVHQPRRVLPRALVLGAGGVILLYLLANVAYLVALPLEEIQQAPKDRVGTELMTRVWPRAGAALMATAIMISTFGCNNGLILVGARASYALARDGLFFSAAGRLNRARVPAWGLLITGFWAAALVLPRTWDGKSFLDDGGRKYGNLYGALLDYVISAALLFYILTIIGLFRLRFLRPNAERPYKVVGYPFVPALYILGAAVIVIVLVIYRPLTTWPGLVIVLLGVPVYYLAKLRKA